MNSLAMKVLAVIPARSGSKSYPDKNIRPFLGKSLIAHSIEQAIAASTVNRVLVSTDSELYASIARDHGAEVPFLRPTELAQDVSTDLDVFRHILNWLAQNESYVPDICVHLRPTYPLRRVSQIDEVVRILVNDPSIDSVRSVVRAPDTPFKMWLRNADGSLRPACMVAGMSDAHSRPRQSLPVAYLQNAAIDAFRPYVATELNSMVGRRIFGYVMDHNYDIDDLTQFGLAEQAGVALSIAEGSALKTFCFDLDGVIATIVPDNDYSKSEPRLDMISKINALCDQGHRIILYTARGTKTGIDWRELTKQQLDEWGLKYHDLHFGKPAADYYIDDRMLPIDKVELLGAPNK